MIARLRQPLQMACAPWALALFVWGYALQASGQDGQNQLRVSTTGPVLDPTLAIGREQILTRGGERPQAVPRPFLLHGCDGFLWNLKNGELLQRFVGHFEEIRAITFSADGEYALTGAGRQNDMGSISADNSARLWDLATGQEIRCFDGHKGLVHTVQFTPDGRRILTSSRDTTTRVWDTETGIGLFALADVTGMPPSATFSPDGSAVLAITRGGRRIIVADGHTGQEQFAIDCRHGTFASAQFRNDGAYIVTAGTDGAVRTWDARTGESLRVFAGHSRQVQHASFTSDGSRVVSGSLDHTIRIWDLESGAEIQRLDIPGEVLRLIISPDDRSVLVRWRAVNTAARSGTSLWNLELQQEVVQFAEQQYGGTAGFTPDGTAFLVTRGLYEDGIVAELRDATTGEVIRSYGERASLE